MIVQTKLQLISIFKGSRLHINFWLECQLGQDLWKTMGTSQKTKYNPVIPLSGIYLKAPETLFWKNNCASVLIATLVTISKISSQEHVSGQKKL